jgi:predicted SnoaL-like aldol condensation-catalyzing enzyme
MGKKNKQIVRDFYQKVINEKRVDLIDDFLSDDYVFHSPPYVGLGFVPDVSSGDKFVVISTAPGGPADGKLLPGDEIVQIEDDENSWSTFHEFDTGFWARGIVGTKIRLQFVREGETHNIEVKRGLIKGFDISKNDFRANYIKYLKQDYPDLKASIDLMISKGDLVASSVTLTGTDSQFERQAIWTECTFSRLAERQISEEWGTSDGLAHLTQLGYKITPPPLK